MPDPSPSPDTTHSSAIRSLYRRTVLKLTGIATLPLFSHPIRAFHDRQTGYGEGGFGTGGFGTGTTGSRTSSSRSSSTSSDRPTRRTSSARSGEYGTDD